MNFIESIWKWWGILVPYVVLAMLVVLAIRYEHWRMLALSLAAAAVGFLMVVLVIVR